MEIYINTCDSNKSRLWLHSQVGQDTVLSRLRQEFEPPWSYQSHRHWPPYESPPRGIGKRGLRLERKPRVCESHVDCGEVGNEYVWSHNDILKTVYHTVCAVDNNIIRHIQQTTLLRK